MRIGAELVNSKRVIKVNLNYIVKRLEACCDIHGGYCGDCPDLEVCRKKYDDRCGLGETICPYCGKEVLRLRLCSECGASLKKLNDKPGKPVKGTTD